VKPRDRDWEKLAAFPISGWFSIINSKLDIPTPMNNGIFQPMESIYKF
jgi:hypothetical protein